LGGISAGRGSYWGDNCRFRLFHPGERIIIGRYCSIFDYVTISAGGNHRPELPSTWPFDNFLKGLPNPTRTYKSRPRQTTIGSDVWIGDSAHIGGGVQIGHGAVVGAAAGVFSDVAPYAVVAGNPARLLQMRFSNEVVAALLTISWWGLAGRASPFPPRMVLSADRGVRRRIRR
jgi:acetyltransferase-like isoleucine patch superfamily enzyme